MAHDTSETEDLVRAAKMRLSRSHIFKISVRMETGSGNARKMEIARIWQWINWKKLLKEEKLKIMRIQSPMVGKW